MTSPVSPPLAAVVVTLGDDDALSDDGPNELGGKGTWLLRLRQRGFAVPPCAVVTTAAYRSVAADPTIRRLLDRIRSGEVVPARDVDDVFVAAPLPDGFVPQVLSAARQVAPAGRLAVRSSASAEDMAGHSFAGQYRSSLDVESTCDDQILRAVRLTWASLWHPAPCAYRREWHISEEQMAMAVVLMRMVPTQLAGVTFTIDPAGEPSNLRIEAVHGSGERLVSGDVTPQVWLVNRDTPTEVPAGAPLPLADVARLALQVESAFGVPQDVEWAWDGHRVWLLQARPITASGADGADDDGSDTGSSQSGPDAELTTAGIDEMLPGVLRPLVWDVASHVTEEALRSVFDGLGAVMNDPARHGFLRRVRGRAALNLDRLKAVAETLPGGSAAEIEREYFGVETAPTGDGDDNGRPGWLRRWSHTFRVATARRQAVGDAEIVLAATDELRAARPVLGSLPDSAVLAYRMRLLDLASRAVRAELAIAATAVARYGELVAHLTTHMGRADAEHEAQRVTSGRGNVAPTPDASRSVFAGPTWAEAGLDAGCGDVAVPPSGDPSGRLRDLQERLRSNPRWPRTRILSGQIVDVRWRMIRRLALDAADGLVLRERTKAAVLGLGGEMRRIHLELGSRLQSRGLLAAAEDVDLLWEMELRHALADSRVPSRGALIRRRRWAVRREAEGPLPPRFHGEPRATDQTPTGIAQHRLHGWAASPGSHTGPAVALALPDPSALPEGAVLVAQATDASWSPVFVRAGAIVVERGGPLSHAAIVARELGLPAVLNLPGATGLLDGHLVTVDGDRGEVLLHDQAPEGNGSEP